MSQHFSLNALTASPESRDGLTHAVKQSLFNHGLATKNDQERMGSTERGGCWASQVTHIVASRDWTLEREKLTPQTLNLVRNFTQEALQWLIDEKHVKQIQIHVEQESNGRIHRLIQLTLNEGDTMELAL